MHLVSKFDINQVYKYMGFIENLKQRLEAEVQARRQREESSRLAKQTEEADRIQREIRERERHEQRRRQAEVFEQESGIGILLDELIGLVDMDPSKKSPKGIQRILPVTSPGSIDVFSNYDSDEINNLKSAIKPLDPDSIYDVIRWDDGQVKVARDYSSREAIRSGQGINRILHHYRKFIGVETTPDGDIIFHSQARKFIPRTAWKDNRDILETALGETYDRHRPAIYIFEEHYWTHGPRADTG